MNKDQVKGRIKQTEGKAKEVIGKLFEDKDLKDEGLIENAVGKVQTAYGDLKEDLKKP